MKMIVKLQKRPTQVKQMDADISGIKKALEVIEPESQSEIERKRQALKENTELIEIFSMFWLMLGQYVTDGILSKKGYIKFNCYIQLALIAHVEKKEALEYATIEYENDIKSFGDLNKVAFFDMMMELIETWSEIINPRYYAAFAWALLGTLADIKVFPPRFKSRRDIKCITYVEHERDILQSYSSPTAMRGREDIRILNEWMNSSDLRPEVQGRLGLRRFGTSMYEDSRDFKDIIEITEKSLARNMDKIEEDSIFSEFDDDDDIDSASEEAKEDIENRDKDNTDFINDLFDEIEERKNQETLFNNEPKESRFMKSRPAMIVPANKKKSEKCDNSTTFRRGSFFGLYSNNKNQDGKLPRVISASYRRPEHRKQTKPRFKQNVVFNASRREEAEGCHITFDDLTGLYNYLNSPNDPSSVSNGTYPSFGSLSAYQLSPYHPNKLRPMTGTKLKHYSCSFDEDDDNHISGSPRVVRGKTPFTSPVSKNQNQTTSLSEGVESPIALHRCLNLIKSESEAFNKSQTPPSYYNQNMGSPSQRFNLEKLIATKDPKVVCKKIKLKERKAKSFDGSSIFED